MLKTHIAVPQSRLVRTVLTVLSALCFVHPAVAVPIDGLGLPSGYADLVGGTVIDFEGNNSGDFATSFSYGNVHMTGNNVLRVTNAFSGSFNVTGNSLALTTNDRTQEITFDFSTPVDAFGFNIGGTDLTWRLTAYSASNAILDNYLIPLLGNANNGEWYGVSVPGIKSARLSNTAFDVSLDSGTLDYIVLDNFTFVGSIPEPATLVLLGAGLLGLGVGRRCHAR